MEKEITYENHRSVQRYRGKDLTNVATGVSLGRAIAFPVTQAKRIVGL